MKKISLIPVIAALVLALPGCGKQGSKEKGSGTDLVTVKTLGLAYLEEFRHEDAEKEFLKFIDLAPKEKFGYANLGLTYLRTGRYDEAKKQLAKAIEIDPSDPDIRLIMATVYQMTDDNRSAIDELKKGLESSPTHIKTLYQLSEIYATGNDDLSKSEREACLRRLSEIAAANIVPRLSLTEILVKSGRSDEALQQLEAIRQIFPEFPKESTAYYNESVALLRRKDTGKAIIQFTIFHNYLKVSAPYQAGMLDLKGPGGSLIGFPVITFDRPNPALGEGETAVAATVKFTDATANAGLEIKTAPVNESNTDPAAHIETADFDSDGDIDIYAGTFSGKAEYSKFLFINESNRFSDGSAKAGIEHSFNETSAGFADIDNDGFFDLLVSGKGKSVLYGNADKGLFREIPGYEAVSGKAGALRLLFLDADHEGDLDIFECSADASRLLRNNGDGSFTDITKQSGLDGKPASDAAFGDFDEDGDLDFAVAGNEGFALWSNQRQGIFKNLALESGISPVKGLTAIAVADFNNDGFPDIAAAEKEKTVSLYLNDKDGTFSKSPSASIFDASTAAVHVYRILPFDYNNDGYTDIAVAGKPATEGKRGLLIFTNDGKGGFTDDSSILPAEITAASGITSFDYNDDGDHDLLVSGINGGIKLLRNDGGNNNHYIKMKLVGLRAGSAKNNYYGIGAKVEMRSGDLYSTLTVTEPDIHFGLGNKSRADVIRITWTNGVPQNIFMPGSDQAIVESQTLKGSCPFLYTWNGNEFVFAKDIIWRSALGMPMGIMSGETKYAFADASDDYIKIPGEILVAEKGILKAKVTSELWETIYTDQLELVAVDYPEENEIFVDEQFSPPPFPGMKIHTTGQKIIPVSATDRYGDNMMKYISFEDSLYIPGYIAGEYQGVSEEKELVVSPGKNSSSENLLLIMKGWIFPSDASINVAMSQSDKLKTYPPLVQVKNMKGEWETVAAPGFPMGKNKSVVTDLSGKFLSADRSVRIITNMDVYWDEVFFAYRDPEVRPVTTVTAASSANLRYRGFSEGYRLGNRYGPHWFNYSKTVKEQRWRDLTGNYTRYGDVLPLLASPDNMYVISNAGDEIEITFDASAFPPLKKGWKRDYLIHSVGWVKDGDMNTATGNTVLPLPFHGMKSYPPSPADKYPDSQKLKEYHRTYNTRIVTGNEFINAIKPEATAK